MPTLDELKAARDAAERAVADAHARAAQADLEYGNAVNAAAREAEAERLTQEGLKVAAARALTINLS